MSFVFCMCMIFSIGIWIEKRYEHRHLCEAYPRRELQMPEDASLFVTFYRLVSDHNLGAQCIPMLLSLSLTIFVCIDIFMCIHYLYILYYIYMYTCRHVYCIWLERLLLPINRSNDSFSGISYSWAQEMNSTEAGFLASWFYLSTV